MQVTATDADDPTYGNSARLVYSILQGQPYFSVEPQTGEAENKTLPSDYRHLRHNLTKTYNPSKKMYYHRDTEIKQTDLHDCNRTKSHVQQVPLNIHT